MVSRQPITIVSLGQAGGILSYKLLEKGYSRSKTNMECNTSVQTTLGGGIVNLVYNPV